MPVVAAGPLTPNHFLSGLTGAAEAEPIEEVGVDREAAEMGGGGSRAGRSGPGAGGIGAGGVVGVDWHRDGAVGAGGGGVATWRDGRGGGGGEGGEVEVGRVEEEEVVEVGEAEGDVGVRAAVVGPAAVWGLRHLLNVVG